eukprot:4710003-Pleurochrysis_carterae.AAC.1
MELRKPVTCGIARLARLLFVKTNGRMRVLLQTQGTCCADQQRSSDAPSDGLRGPPPAALIWLRLTI